MHAHEEAESPRSPMSARTESTALRGERVVPDERHGSAHASPRSSRADEHHPGRPRHGCRNAVLGRLSGAQWSDHRTGPEPLTSRARVRFSGGRDAVNRRPPVGALDVHEPLLRRVSVRPELPPRSPHPLGLRIVEKVDPRLRPTLRGSVGGSTNPVTPSCTTSGSPPAG